VRESFPIVEAEDCARVWECPRLREQGRDYNKLQAMGRSEESPGWSRWRRNGGARVRDEGGDGMTWGDRARARRAASERGRPSAIVAHTVKGKGVSFMEDDLGGTTGRRGRGLARRWGRSGNVGG